MKIIVPTCEKYHETWTPFIRLLRIYWPNCKYPVKLLMDVEPTSKYISAGLYEGYIVLNKDYGWSENLSRGLEKEGDAFVLLMMDDFFISDHVRSNIIDRAYERIACDDKINCIRLMPCPGADYALDEDFGVIESGASYRVSAQAAIWRVSALKDILKNTDTAWSFEIDGSKSNPAGTYLSVYRRSPFPLPYLNTAIIRGKWNPDAFKLCKNNNIELNAGSRTMYSPS